MATTKNHEELVELLQEGRIGYLQFVRTVQTPRTNPQNFMSNRRTSHGWSVR